MESRLRLAESVHEALRLHGATLAVAESLTGGLLGAALTDVAGSSATFRGGFVAYATDLKASQLGVDRALLAAHGAVHPEVALAMARGVRDRLGATYGAATTGVAGPDTQDGQPPGTVFVAVAGPVRTGATPAAVSAAPAAVSAAVDRVLPLVLSGGRRSVRDATVRAALRLLVEALTP